MKNPTFKQIQLFVISMFTLSVIQACITAEVVSNKDPKFSYTINHILIVYKAENAQDSMGYFFGNRMAELLKANKMDAEVSVYDALALKSEATWLAENEQKVEQVRMELNRSSPTIVRQRDPDNILDVDTFSGYFDIKLFLFEKPDPFWRASVHVDNTADFMRFPETGRKMAENVFKQMKKDGLFYNAKRETTN